MSETREKYLSVAMEPTLVAILRALIRHEKVTQSAYLRSLVIKDLRERGLLTESVMHSILV